MKTGKQVQKRAQFHGHVQGVGFRFTTARAAGGYDVTGYVKNCPDGSVECLAEGQADEVNAFLQDVRDKMGGYIHDVKFQSAPASGRYRSFDVTF